MVTPAQAYTLLWMTQPLPRILQPEIWAGGVLADPVALVSVVQTLLDPGQASNVKSQMVQRVGLTHTDAVLRWTDIMARLHANAHAMGVI